MSTNAWIVEGAALAIKSAASDALPFEAGGILIGVKAEGRPLILAAISVPSQETRRNAYKLPKDARPASVALYREVEPRAGYLGDWHSHPAEVGPSGIDISSMRSLGRGRRSPLLVLAVLIDGEFRLKAYQVNSNYVETVCLAVSGPLESEKRDDYQSAQTILS